MTVNISCEGDQHNLQRNYRHRFFGGLLEEDDFSTENYTPANARRSAAAKKILADFRFDEKCRKRLRYRETGNWEK